jgi:monoterpene epsilon-lactone hydrolase
MSQEEHLYLEFSNESPGAASHLMKKAALKKQALMGDMTVEEQRAAQQKLHEALPALPGIKTFPVTLGEVECEWVGQWEVPTPKIILYLHGGGWLMGNRVISRHAASLFAQATELSVLSVEYRLAPEHPFPAGLEDCRTVWNALLQLGYRPEHIALLGDSAGGNLCLALVHLLLGEGASLPCAVGLLSPVTDVSEKSTFQLCPPPLAFAYWQGKRQSIIDLYAQGHPFTNPLLSPVYGDLQGFPPLLIHVGGDEPLAVDCAALAKKAHSQGVDAFCKIWREMFHDFSLAGPALRESRQSVAEMGEFLRNHLG